ncbi:PsbP domain-containing protein [Heracleum sosnowskyi]|uniref:PsbP domain-containing protein n=1 Tax=Heracleum sosnowskyi TaxID=360622 RepID=A0AAD8N268_9APIA|nr:PsbP domain-containing protein [Heracleum sosnowskyi]
MANYTPLFAYHHNTLFQPPPTLFHPRLHNFICNSSTSSPANNKFSVHLSKRLLLNLSISTLLLSSSSLCNVIAAEEEPELIRYTDSLEGFTFLRPSSYIKVEKAGATVLFEEANKGANNVGVVVTPVRLTNLGEFGTPQFVADKLIQAEKRKESTKEADVIAVSERSGPGGLQVYEFEYKVDSSRGGIKRIFSSAFVASRKLSFQSVSTIGGNDTTG